MCYFDQNCKQDDCWPLNWQREIKTLEIKRGDYIFDRLSMNETENEINNVKWRCVKVVHDFLGGEHCEND